MKNEEWKEAKFKELFNYKAVITLIVAYSLFIGGIYYVVR